MQETCSYINSKSLMCQYVLINQYFKAESDIVDTFRYILCPAIFLALTPVTDKCLKTAIHRNKELYFAIAKIKAISILCPVALFDPSPDNKNPKKRRKANKQNPESFRVCTIKISVSSAIRYN